MISSESWLQRSKRGLAGWHLNPSMGPVVVDTNVGLVANGEAGQASATCVRTCLTRLQEIVAEGQVVLDSAHLILDEYLKQKPHGFPQGPGDLFFVWANDNQANPERCRVVTITPLENDPRGFAEFPDDPELAAFDQDDRKFVAVAIASPEAVPILEAVDIKWWAFREPLARHGVEVEFLCPEMMDKQGG